MLDTGHVTQKLFYFGSFTQVGVMSDECSDLSTK